MKCFLYPQIQTCQPEKQCHIVLDKPFMCLLVCVQKTLACPTLIRDEYPRENDRLFMAMFEITFRRCFSNDWTPMTSSWPIGSSRMWFSWHHPGPVHAEHKAIAFYGILSTVIASFLHKILRLKRSRLLNACHYLGCAHCRVTEKALLCRTACLNRRSIYSDA